MPLFQRKPYQVRATKLSEPKLYSTPVGEREYPAGTWEVVMGDGQVVPYRDDVFRREFEPVDKQAALALNRNPSNLPKLEETQARIREQKERDRAAELKALRSKR